MTKLEDRLREVMAEMAWEHADLVRVSGMKSSVVSQWLGNGSKEIKSIGDLEAAMKIQHGSGFSALWVATGKGEKKARSSAAMPGYALGSALDHAPDLHGPVPLISWVQAGKWHEIVHVEAEDWLWSAKPVSPRAFALRVRGDSMTAPYGPSYREGSIIFVDPVKLSPVNGDRIVARLVEKNEATFKVFKMEDGRRWLAPLNVSHQPLFEPFDVIGTVIGQWVD